MADNKKSSLLSLANYRKIAAEGVLEVSIPSVSWDLNTDPIAIQQRNVPHGVKVNGVGVIPTLKVFTDITGGLSKFPAPYGGQGSVDGTPSVGSWFGFTANGPYNRILVDEAFIYFQLANRSGFTINYKLYWRAYYDTAN